ncbi:membrane anchor subunit of succinate dehydrogenase, Sdh4 [Rhizina undulata]
MASFIKSSLRAATATSPAARIIARPTPSAAAFHKPSHIAYRQSFVKHRAAAFHTSKSLKILPAGPQVIEGTVNDAAKVPEPNAAHGSYHWSFERLVSVALIPLTVAPFAAGSLNPVTDAILGATIVIHSHIGFESIIIDYIPRNKYPGIRKAFMWALKGATVLVLVGFYEFETNDVGITEAVKRIWKA